MINLIYANILRNMIQIYNWFKLSFIQRSFSLKAKLINHSYCYRLVQRVQRSLQEFRPKLTWHSRWVELSRMFLTIRCFLIMMAILIYFEPEMIHRRMIVNFNWSSNPSPTFRLRLSSKLKLFCLIFRPMQCFRFLQATKRLKLEVIITENTWTLSRLWDDEPWTRNRNNISYVLKLACKC